MAGIGFELKKLFRRKGILASLWAGGYAGIVCTGPMLLGAALQAGILFLCGLAGTPRPEQDLLVCMITYTLLASLLGSSFFSMPVTRFLADMLYEEKTQAVLPSFWGCNALLLFVGCALYGGFLLFSGASLLQGLLCLWLFAVMAVNWNAISYLTAIKDYRGILCSFLAAVCLAMAAGSIVVLWANAPAVEGFLFAVTAGYGGMLVLDVLLLQRAFGQSAGSPWQFLHWMDKYLPLAFTGLFMMLGLFSHLVILWAGPLGVQVKGLFYGAPYYDVPALLAFLSVLLTTVNFVVSVEVEFYPRYRAYYGAFNQGGAAAEIAAAEKQMLAVLNRELWYTGLKQLFFTAAVISLEEILLDSLPLGFNDMMHGTFRTLCVGYGLYAVGNTVLLMLLYFTDYRGAVTVAAIFAVTASAGTAVSLWGNTAYYGFGFLAGAAVFYLAALLRLNGFASNLLYRILGSQPMVLQEPEGLFTKLEKLLEHSPEPCGQTRPQCPAASAAFRRKQHARH